MSGPAPATRDEYIDRLAIGAKLPVAAANAMLAGFMAGRMIPFEAISQDPFELATDIRDFALLSANPPVSSDGVEAPAISPTAVYRLEVDFRAPLSAALAVTSDILQRALPRAWKPRVEVTRVQITTGEGAEAQTASRTKEEGE